MSKHRRKRYSNRKTRRKIYNGGVLNKPLEHLSLDELKDLKVEMLDLLKTYNMKKRKIELRTDVSLPGSGLGSISFPNKKLEKTYNNIITDKSTTASKIKKIEDQIKYKTEQAEAAEAKEPHALAAEAAVAAEEAKAATAEADEEDALRV